MLQELLSPLPFQGKSFYLDAVRSHSSAILLEAITRLGGKVDSFLNRNVSFIISGNKEAQQDSPSLEVTMKDGVASSPMCSHQAPACDSSSQRMSTPRPQVCGSRGKALLEKAIRNKEHCQRSSVLDTARSWGVKTVHVDDFLLYIERVTAENSRAKDGKRKAVKSPHVIKVEILKSPYLKIEDYSRKYRPLHLQCRIFPTVDYMSQFSPFEPAAPLQLCKVKDQKCSKTRIHSEDPGSSKSKLPSLTPSISHPHRKTAGYCECCQLSYKEQEKHLESSCHRQFAQESSHYSSVDQLVALMQPGFNEVTLPRPDLIRLSSLLTLPIDLSLELLPQLENDAELAIEHLLLPPGCKPTLIPLFPVEEKEVCRDYTIPLEPEEVEQVSPTTPPLPFTPEKTNQIVQEKICTELEKDGILPSLRQNHRKRCRSFSFSPSRSKRRKVFQTASDPTFENSPFTVNSNPRPFLQQLEAQSSNASMGKALESKTYQIRTQEILHVEGSACKHTEEEMVPRVDHTVITDDSGVSLFRSIELTPNATGFESSIQPTSSVNLNPYEVTTPCVPFKSPTETTPVKTCQPINLGLKSHTVLETHLQSLPLQNELVFPAFPHQDTQKSPALLSHSFSSSICIDSALLPDPPSSSESDWDCGLFSSLATMQPVALPSVLDLDLLQKPCTEVNDTSYELRLCSVLQPPTPPDTDPVLACGAAQNGEEIHLTLLKSTLTSSGSCVQ